MFQLFPFLGCRESLLQPRMINEKHNYFSLHSLSVSPSKKNSLLSGGQGLLSLDGVLGECLSDCKPNVGISIGSGSEETED